jgi:hypothetical protein
MKSNSIPLFILIPCLMTFPSVTQAQTPDSRTLNPIGATTALQAGAMVQIFPGRASVINFKNDEFITSVTLSDPTYVLYSPNAEIDSGQATALILRLSNGISFDNLSRSSKPNISITTINPENEQNTYLFDLQIASGLPQANQDYNGIVIVADEDAIDPNGNVIQTTKGDATINHIERGLRIAIRRGFTNRGDPIVNQVREILAQVRNGGSVRAIARRIGVPLSVLAALGELGLEARR